MLSTEDSVEMPHRRLGRTALAGTAVAIALVSGCFLLASSTGAVLTVGVRDTVNPVPFGAAVFATAAAGGGAYLLGRWAGRIAHPRRTFLLVTIVGLLASAVPPLQASSDAATAIWLLVMHAAAALALIPAVASALPTARRSGVVTRSAMRITGSAGPDTDRSGGLAQQVVVEDQ